MSNKCYPLNLVPQAPHMPNHVSTTNHSNLLLFNARRSQYLTIEKQVLKSFFPFNAIANTVNNNSINTHFAEIFNNMVSAHSTFILLLIYTINPTIFSPSSNIQPIQSIHATISTTSTIPTVLSEIHVIHLINGPTN